MQNSSPTAYSKPPPNIRESPRDNIRRTQKKEDSPREEYSDSRAPVFDEEEPIPSKLEVQPAPHFMEASTIESPEKEATKQSPDKGYSMTLEEEFKDESPAKDTIGAKSI